MRYALMEDGKVLNVIALFGKNAAEFANAVPGELAVIGDTYREGRFYSPEGSMRRTQEELYEELAMSLADAQAALAELGIAQEEVEQDA